MPVAQTNLYVECCVSFHTFSSYCKLKDEDAKEIIQYQRWPRVDDLFELCENNRFVIVLKAKQAGISYFTIAYALWKMLTVPIFTIAYISASKKAGIKWLKKLKLMYDMLPDELKVPIKEYNQTYLEFDGLLSSVSIFSSIRQPGLGDHFSLAIDDEYDFHRFPDDDWATIEATTNMGGSAIILSTRNKKAGNTRFYTTYVKAKEGENEFKPFFISCFDRPGRDEEWYATLDKKYKGEESWRKMENYPRTEEEALSPLTGLAFFNQDTAVGITLQQLADSCVEPIENRGDVTFIYKKYVPGRMYVLAADCAVGQGGDYQAGTLWEKSGATLDLAAVIHSKNIMTDAFAVEIERLAVEYGKHLVAVEANSYGESVISKLEQLEYGNLFYRDRKHNKRGFFTGNQKEQMLRELGIAFAKGDMSCRFKPLINEMLYFQRTSAGIRCVKGHDDLVMSAAIAWTVGKDLFKPLEWDADTTSPLATISTGGMFAV